MNSKVPNILIIYHTVFAISAAYIIITSVGIQRHQQKMKLSVPYCHKQETAFTSVRDVWEDK